MYRDFVAVLRDKVTGNIDLVCKRIYASVIAKELGLHAQKCFRFSVQYS